MEAGAEYGLRPVGVGAVMMIRLEAGMVMGEFEYDETISPWEASLGWAVDLDKGDFRGRDAVVRLRDERRTGSSRRPRARRGRSDRRRAEASTARRSAT